MKKKAPDWKLGKYRGHSMRGFAEQGIDYRIKIASDQHFSKIVVYDVGCKKIAEKIVKFLNTL